MDKSNKTGNCDKKENKMVVKFVGGSGGIGAVILLGGVLATAALASAFAARRKGRSSNKDRRSFHRNPPPENDKLSEQDEGDNDTLTLDVKMNGVSDDGFVIVDDDFPHSEGKLPLEFQNNYSKERENQEQVCIEEEAKQEENFEVIEVDKDVDEEREGGLKEDMQVNLVRESEAEMMSEKKCLEIVVTEDGNEEREGTQIVQIVDEERDSGLKEDIEVKLEREEVEGFCSDDEELTSEKKCLESVADGNEERESGLHTQIVETVVEDEEKLVEKQENCEGKPRNETRGKIEEREENITIPHEKNKEENGYIIHHTPNEEVEFDAKENVEKEVDVSADTINEGIDDKKGGMDLETSEEEEEEAVIVEESSLGNGDSSSESNSEAVWPAESAKPKLIDYEVGEHDDQTTIEENTFIDKYYMGEMGMKKDHRTNLGRRRVVIASFSLLSSLSCSWFFGLSFANLCLLVCLTMLLSEIHAY